MVLLLGVSAADAGALSFSAPAPVLEFVASGHGLPVGFTTEGGLVNAEMAGFSSLVHCAASQGEGEITGPRSATLLKYRLTECVTERASHQSCTTKGAQEGEITAGPIAADLVYIDQARREVAMLLNPGGGTYISFECGGEAAEGRGPFLAPVSPLDQEASIFTATLSQSGSVQMPDEYEGPSGERLRAIPEGRRGTQALVPTGVEMAVLVHTSVPIEIETMTVEEIETRRREEEATKQREQKQGEEAALLKKRQEEEATTRKHQEEAASAKKKHEEEEERERKKTKPLTRGQLLVKALRQCKKEPKRRQARCEARAHRNYGPKTVKRKKG